MAGSGKSNFEYGVFGEILPAPLLEGLDPDEALKRMVGEETYATLSTRERELFYGDAAVFAQQERLAQTFSGQSTVIEGAINLYRAVVNGARLSLRPLGFEQEQYDSFAPVFSRMPNGKWRVGLPGEGKTQIIETYKISQAYLQARELYAQWAEQES